jgi:hypothetical protein
VAVLRDAVLRTAPQDEVRGPRLHPVRSDRFHGINPLVDQNSALRFRREQSGNERDRGQQDQHHRHPGGTAQVAGQRRRDDG